MFGTLVCFLAMLFLCACSTAIPEEHIPILPASSPTTRLETKFTPIRTPSPYPIPSQAPEEMITPAMKTPVDILRITIIYDNNPFDSRLKTAWGFSALVEYHDHTLLFDTGGDGAVLFSNMQTLGIEPARIQSVVLSHAHGDHTTGLLALLGAGLHPRVYLPPSFAQAYKSQIGQLTQVTEVVPGLSIAEGIFTTGEIDGSIPEQSLVIRTNEGLVIITGCAHPGIIRIIEQVASLSKEPVHLVLGGFHLGSKSQTEINGILADFRRLGVQKVAPCHCTGERAIVMFAAEYGKDFIIVGAGSIIAIGE